MTNSEKTPEIMTGRGPGRFRALDPDAMAALEAFEEAVKQLDVERALKALDELPDTIELGLEQIRKTKEILQSGQEVLFGKGTGNIRAVSELMES